MISKNQNSLLLSKIITHRILKNLPMWGSNPERTFGFKEVKYEGPGFDPHIGRFLGPYEYFFDNNKLFLFFKIIH